MSATDMVKVDPGGFEGPEKRLEVDFKLLNPERPAGLRALTREQWQELLTYAKCQILSMKSNDSFDCFVLSESSLFVYPTKIMLKTCGTTTLLMCIPKLLEYADACELAVEFVMFSRKNFIFPDLQLYPHNNWKIEVDFLNTIFDGACYVLGPQNREHWNLYIADYHDHNTFHTYEQTMELMMRDLDRDCAQQFYRTEEKNDTDKFPGMDNLIEGSETDEYNFRPCGYSMNGLNGDAYYTIHVTPEPHCSYASFETNASLPSYHKLMESVLDIFRPGSFTLTIFTEKRDSGIQENSLEVATLPGYKLQHRTFCQLEGNCDVLFCNFVADRLDEPNKRPALTSADLTQIKTKLGIH
jgi:S-adenosylmethionine decarboxylase